MRTSRRRKVRLVLALPRVRRSLAALASAAVSLVGVVTVPAGASAQAPARYAINRPLCTAGGMDAARAGQFRCYAVERQPATAGTPGAYRVSGKYGSGPAHGYTPAELARAYGYDPSKAVDQTVAIVDWYDDPNVLADLNAFDRTYHLPAETARSFRKVNQDGRATPLPARSRRAATEIALDVQAVRAVCHRCRILLVEANNPAAADLAQAENTAARLGADEISNSFGGLESGATRRLVAAFHHPGVVVVASTGDEGWLGWDLANAGYWTDGQASFPASDPDVVAVGGTTLRLSDDGSRASETVWNNDGANNGVGSTSGALGASGGGCSGRFAAGSWQWHAPGFAALKCGADGRHRMTADLAVVGDPETGFDVRDSYGHPNRPGGWLTVGGTSLSAPLVAGMYALAGGSGGSAFPAASLYVNRARHPHAAFDVTVGGNGYCGGEVDLAKCMASVAALPRSVGNNPNGITGEPLDCSFRRDGISVTRAPQPGRQCNAGPGLDGPSGLGAPVGLGLFRPTSAVGRVDGRRRVARHHSYAWRAALRARVPGTSFTGFAWNWGDGNATHGTSATARHSYKRPGRYEIRLTAFDSLHQIVVRTAVVHVIR